MTQKKRTYIAPSFAKYKSVQDLPEKFRTIAASILEDQPPLLVTIDEDRRYIRVSEEFARLLGYTSRELIGRRIDDITAKDTLDIELSFRVTRRFGELQGLWLFDARNGKQLLCSYRARRVDSTFTAELKPLYFAA